MAKRQLRIHELGKIADKESLIGELATFCLNDKRAIFGTIIDFKNARFTIKDKLLKKHSFSMEDIAEIIVEKENLIEDDKQIC